MRKSEKDENSVVLRSLDAIRKTPQKSGLDPYRVFNEIFSPPLPKSFGTQQLSRFSLKKL
jgi:hypothetical protein